MPMMMAEKQPRKIQTNMGATSGRDELGNKAQPYRRVVPRKLPPILHARIGLKKPEVFVLGITVGHAGEIIADGALQDGLLGTLRIALGQLFGRPAILGKNLLHEPPTLGRHAHDPMMSVDSLMQK